MANFEKAYFASAENLNLNSIDIKVESKPSKISKLYKNIKSKFSKKPNNNATHYYNLRQVIKNDRLVANSLNATKNRIKSEKINLKALNEAEEMSGLLLKNSYAQLEDLADQIVETTEISDEDLKIQDEVSGYVKKLISSSNHMANESIIKGLKSNKQSNIDDSKVNKNNNKTNTINKNNSVLIDGALSKYIDQLEGKSSGTKTSNGTTSKVNKSGSKTSDSETTKESTSSEDSDRDEIARSSSTSLTETEDDESSDSISQDFKENENMNREIIDKVEQLQKLNKLNKIEIKKVVKDSLIKSQRRRLNNIKNSLTKQIAEDLYTIYESEDPLLPEGTTDATFYSPFEMPVKIDNQCQTTSLEQQTDIDQPQTASDHPTEYIRKINIKSLQKFAHKGKWSKSYPKLSYHLRIKYHMSVRNYTTYTYMKQDARTWMLKNGFTCDNQFDYQFMVACVNAAFVIQDEEIITREVIKDKINLPAMHKINEFVAGDLGHLPREGILGCGYGPTILPCLATKKRATFGNKPTQIV